MRTLLAVVFFVALSLAGCPASGIPDAPNPEAIVIFHNNSGSMCLAALNWLADIASEHPALVVEEHLTYQAGERALLRRFESRYNASEGVSGNFEYLPIIFFQGHAFSGFDAEVGQELEALMAAAQKAA
ncbi:MAG: hypothetical protein KBH81_08400 [Phycisphaerae bacterium]|nr:hypothetical protein [Phycisphaerae bacterium]NLG43578.1 hypothetical protein [Phycisphaerae bacterium]HOO17941.1 hypothetical protein [Phycisphaerae bacterium]HPC23678.1 hypothetical protein [Phycisphaerae bacterium]HRS29515.1 hypothetical protein [Phycisphaerae bacterium]